MATGAKKWPKPVSKLKIAISHGTPPPKPKPVTFVQSLTAATWAKR